jgi:hypothetical protein
MFTVELREKLVQLSTQLLPLLESQQRIDFRDAVTGDESWILPHYDHRQTWCVSADEVPTRVSHTIAAPDSMQRVYETWIERLNQVMGTDGDHVQSQFF